MGKARKKKDIAITGVMAKWYDRNTRESRMKEMASYADIVSGHAKAGASVLEVAPGPGYLAIELAKRGFAVSGVEISRDFVEIERHNAAQAGVEAKFYQGNASMLPLSDGAFDFAICCAAFKNFSEPLKALNELFRVLKPAGAALILDMRGDATNGELEEAVGKSGAKGFDRWFMRLSFKTFLRKGAYSKEGFEELAAKSDFEKYRIAKDGISYRVWLYKGSLPS
jgi:ubiquinone/menaquinone biosynthesis C-methylase UbiE